MKYLTVLISLATAASAVDLYLHTNNDCGGSSLRCNGFNPNDCCGIESNDSPYQSIAVRGIPDGWALQGRGYDAGGCSRLQTVSGNNGNPWICNRSNGFRYTGAGYNFFSQKRAEPKSECQRPETLILSDGTEYDMAGLDDNDFNTL